MLANDDDTGPPPESYQTVWKYDSDGELLDKFNLSPMTDLSAVAMADSDHLYAFNYLSSLRLISEETQQIVWEVQGLYACTLYLVSAADAGGNFVYGGSFDGDCYIVKYDQSGELLWNWRYNPTIDGLCAVLDLAVDDQNNVVAAGDLWRLVSVDGFVVRLSDGGNVLWSKELDTNHDQEDLVKLAIGPQGDISVSGYTTPADRLTMYLHSYGFAADGAPLWHDRYRDEVDDYVNITEKVAVDEEGNTYLWLGRSRIYRGKSAPYYSLRFNKYDSMGVLMWSRKIDRKSVV